MSMVALNGGNVDVDDDARNNDDVAALWICDLLLYDADVI